MERISYQELPQGIYEQVLAIEEYIKQSPLDYSLIELVKLRLSQINQCAYCVDMHHKELKHAGETELRLSSVCVWRQTPYFTETERTLLHFAEELNALRAVDASFEKMAQYFNKEEIAYWSLVITQINTWNRLTHVFKTTPGEYKVA